MDYREDEERGPLFVSDNEARPDGPRYEPIRPEGGMGTLLRRLLAPLVALGLLLTKFKFVLLALFKLKFVGTSVSMLVSVGAYALLFPLPFAVGFVALIWIHEMGHVLQLRREGIKASAPMFIPFLGAFVAMKEMPKDALAEARVGLAGPLLGTLGALGALGLYALTTEPLLLGLAYVGFFLNLFNLAPMLPLDGGRAVGAMSPLFWVLGVLVMVGLLFVRPNPYPASGGLSRRDGALAPLARAEDPGGAGLPRSAAAEPGRGRGRIRRARRGAGAFDGCDLRVRPLVVGVGDL